MNLGRGYGAADTSVICRLRYQSSVPLIVFFDYKAELEWVFVEGRGPLLWIRIASGEYRGSFGLKVPWEDMYTCTNIVDLLNADE